MGFAVFIIIIVLAMIAVVVFNSKRQKNTETVTATYAKAHGWTVNTAVPSVPALEKLGYTKRNALIEGTLDGFQFWIYEYVLNGGRNKVYVPNMTIALPVTSPELLVMRNNNLGTLSNAFAAGGYGLQLIQLEGDFNQHLLAYCEAGNQVATLEYLTPNVMAVLEDNFPNGVLFSGQYIAFDIPRLQTSQQLDQVLQSAHLLLSALKERLSVQLNSNSIRSY
ncbi:MAG TPA: hypothetical protein VFN51_01395 [Candidatus Saccharimonadales bacterium]|nr:hypothetical protein [Candidatus Saccharimonadales bacterium]